MYCTFELKLFHWLKDDRNGKSCLRLHGKAVIIKIDNGTHGKRKYVVSIFVGKNGSEDIISNLETCTVRLESTPQRQVNGGNNNLRKLLKIRMPVEDLRRQEGMSFSVQTGTGNHSSKFSTGRFAPTSTLHALQHCYAVSQPLVIDG
jgi:hypothetical protein